MPGLIVQPEHLTQQDPGLWETLSKNKVDESWGPRPKVVFWLYHDTHMWACMPKHHTNTHTHAMKLQLQTCNVYPASLLANNWILCQRELVFVQWYTDECKCYRNNEPLKETHSHTSHSKPVVGVTSDGVTMSSSTRCKNMSLWVGWERPRKDAKCDF